MEHPPSLLEQAAVGDLVREGVLEGVARLGEELRLVEELGRLQVCQAVLHGAPRGASAMACSNGEGHLRADDGGRLQEALLLWWQPVDACRQHRLHRGRHLKARQRLRQAIGAALAHQHPGLHQRAHALLQEEGVALGARNQERRERPQAGIVPEQGLQERRRRWPGGKGSSRSCV